MSLEEIERIQKTMRSESEKIINESLGTMPDDQRAMYMKP